MARTLKRRKARAVAQDHGNNSVFIQHAEFDEDDVEWLRSTERLTLWNVTMPPGFLAKLKELWWLDIRGGSASNLAGIRGANRLRYLAVNQVRGMRDLTVAAELQMLQFIKLYGLPQVEKLPSFAGSRALERADLGQLRGLMSLDGILEAPSLRELLLIRKMNVSAADVNLIRRHPSLRNFSWFAEDVPVKTWEPVVNAIALDQVAIGQFPADWFKMRRKECP